MREADCKSALRRRAAGLLQLVSFVYMFGALLKFVLHYEREKSHYGKADPVKRTRQPSERVGRRVGKWGNGA